MTKTTYAVQWFDEEENRWRNHRGTKCFTLDQGLSELELHRTSFPSIDARLVKLETITTIQDIILTAPEAT
jgi:hypothetical protein